MPSRTSPRPSSPRASCRRASTPFRTGAPCASPASRKTASTAPSSAGREVPEALDTARAERLALVGLLVNLGLATVKLLSGLLGHSYALVADAMESMTDIIGSAVIWGGLHIARRPADEDHPYGHGKAEAIAAL